MDEWGVLALNGGDALKFLQGQVTCDVQALSPASETIAGRSSLGALCTAQGRVLAVFRVWRQGGGLFLLAPRERLAAMQKRLSLYVLRADVKFSPVADRRLFGVAGARAAEVLGLAADLNDDEVVAVAGSVFMRVPSVGAPRYLCWVEETGAVWSDALPSVDAAHWRLEDVRAGLPEVSAAVSEEFIPQMLNLDRLGGVSFQKGCYTGQEIVARTHYLGQSKRRLFRFRAPGPLNPGDALRALGEEESTGKVVSCAPDSQGGFELLAVVNLAAAEQATTQWRAGERVLTLA